MIHLIFEKRDTFFQQLNQYMTTNCLSIVHIEHIFCMSKIDLNNFMRLHITHLQSNGVYRMYSTCTYNRQTICCYFLVELIKKKLSLYKKKPFFDLPRQVIFLSCSAFFARYFCCSSLSWNKTISNLKTRYWGHTWSRSKGRVIHLFLEVFSVWYQWGSKSTNDNSTGKERTVANLG